MTTPFEGQTWGESQLRNFEARESDDDVKRDLELTCTRCGTVVCDIEHGDTLSVLVSVAADHACPEEEEEEKG